MMEIKSKIFMVAYIGAGLLSATAQVKAAEYAVDIKGMHAFIQFRVQHLGYSWLYGRFNSFNGKFSYDKSAPEKSSATIVIKTKSVDTNHAERDKHLRGKDFLDVAKFPEAKFVSTAFLPDKAGIGGILKGNFTLHGVTKPIEIKVERIGGGKDPWGGFRQGFEGRAKFAMADYGILKFLGPKSKDVELILSIEGTRLK